LCITTSWLPCNMFCKLLIVIFAVCVTVIHARSTVKKDKSELREMTNLLEKRYYQEGYLTCPRDMPTDPLRCPGDSTCCVIYDDTDYYPDPIYGCCSLPNAVCCDQYCCPNDYSCGAGVEKCIMNPVAVQISDPRKILTNFDYFLTFVQEFGNEL